MFKNFTRVYKMQNIVVEKVIPFSTIKCFLVKDSAAFFSLFCLSGTPLKWFYEGFLAPATVRVQYITWQKEESIFLSTYLLEE